MCCICNRYTHAKCLIASNRESLSDKEYICNICELTEEGKKKKEEILKSPSIIQTIKSNSSLLDMPQRLQYNHKFEDPLISLIYFSEEPTLFLDHYIAVYNGSDTWKIAKVEKYNSYHKRYHAKVEGDKTQWVRLDNSGKKPDIWRFIPTVTAMKVERKNTQVKYTLPSKDELISPFTSNENPDDISKNYLFTPLSTEEECIGEPICVLKAEKLWFPAVIEEYDSFSKKHMIRYDNDEVEWIESNKKYICPPKLCIEASLCMKYKSFDNILLDNKKQDGNYHLPIKMALKQKSN